MISIIIPIYNREKYLRKCFDSVINQTFSDFEVILVDDGSTDASLQICEEYVAKDKRFKLISQSNQGVSVARNQGIAQATRLYVTFIDSDDWIESDMLELLYKSLLENNADISCCGYFIDELQKTTPVWNDGTLEIWNREQALTKLFINHQMKDFAWAKLFKKQLFEGVDFPKDTCFEDIYVMYRLFDKSECIVKINQPKYHYLQHDNNITAMAATTVKKEIDLFLGIKLTYDFVKENPQKILKNKHDKVLAQLLRQMYRVKKQVINRFSLKSDDYKKLAQVIDPELRVIISELGVKKIGVIKYVGMMLSIHCPMVFAFSFWLTGKRERIF